ncbi:MAG TPA: hypothetical protein VN371_10055 [Chlorobaculum sp.]|nr:hypothetical protein [Chlorobaculum sp.]
MKNVLRVFLLLAISGTIGQSNLFAGSALQDLKNTSRDSEAATREPSSEGARSGASQNFDTSASTPVDLSGKRGVVDPNDLKQYDPKPIRVQGNPPPPL